MIRLPKTITDCEIEGKAREGKADTGNMDYIRYSMEKYRLRVEDTTNREERFSSRNSCLYCFISIACILIAVFGPGKPQQRGIS
jgi:hypothetical protein